MGQDDRCGICGKHYQDCKHYVKEHIASKGRALCGQKNAILLPSDWESLDLDPGNTCKRCVFIRKEMGNELRRT